MTSIRLLVTVWGSLMLLTLLTVAVSYVDFGNWNLYVALFIALVKASLVVLFFMHLRYDRPFNAIIFVGCLILVTLFISFSMTDSGAYRSTMLGGQAKDVRLQSVSEPPSAGLK